MNRLRPMLIGLAIVLGSVLAHVASATDRSLKIACDWDFPPYEYLNVEGPNAGFCFEVLHTILNALDIPHEFVMGSRQKAVDDFFAHKADLIIDYGQRFTGEPYCRSLNILGYYDVVLARRNSSKPISRVEQISGETIAVNVVNDSLPFDIVMRFSDRSQLECYTAREALGALDNGSVAYFLWGREPLRWKIRQYNLQNVVLDTLDIDALEIHVVGYDKELISNIDDRYARLQQGGKIRVIREKWFHPELAAKHSSPLVWGVVAGVLLLSLLVIVVLRFTRYRVRKALERNSVTEAMMRQALSMGNFTVITNNLRRNLVTNQHGHSVPDEGITMKQMMERIHPDDREAMTLRREVMRKLKGKPYPYRMRWNQGTAEKPDWHTITGFSYPEMGKLPVPKNIVIISRDITDELRREKENRELASRYMKMFDSSLIAMSFYDKDGHLINLNENMKKLCGLDEKSLRFFWTTTLFENEMMKGDFDPHSTHHFHICHHMCYPTIGLDKYVELHVTPILDDGGQLIYYVITARDTTDERNMYLGLQQQRKALSETSSANRLHAHRLRTLLENSNMYVWHADVEARTISFSRSLHDDEFSMTFDDYVNYIDSQAGDITMGSIKTVLSSAKPFNVTRHFRQTPASNTPQWFAVSGMPLLGDDGKTKELFGVVRDVTTLMEAQQRLREETARAENSTMLKSTFLANMTHEIRTPLNAIVGFSDLLQAVTDPAERKEFINIIHNNCDMLLRLINDIFEASNLDVKPLAIVPQRVDFAREFAVVCQSLAQRVQEPGVEFIAECPRESFVTDIDMGRIQQVITNFVTNAVKYTHQGHIRVGYQYTASPHPSAPASQKGLYIYCEDTGAGIPKDKQARVFDRFVKLNDFVQGTGLGLAICKSIAQGCGGQIGLYSEGEGHGSTFWIWVPASPAPQAATTKEGQPPP